MKKAITLLLAAAMCTTMFASCGGGDSSSASASTDTGSGETASTGSSESAEGGESSGESGSLKMAEETEIVFAFPASGMYTDEGLQMVEDGVNEITVANDNVRVNIEAIASNTYTNQIGMMMAGGEQLDVFGMLGTYSTMLSKNQLMNLSPYMDTYGQGIHEALGDEFLKATTNQGSLYALPNNNGKAAVLNVILRTDVIEDNNISLDGLYQASTWDEYMEVLDEVGNIFEQMKAAEPDMYCASSVSNSMNFMTSMPLLDKLNDYFGVLMDGETTVVNYYESEEYAQLLDIAHDWYQKGYIMQDAATTTEAQNTYIQAGVVMGGFIVGEEGQAEQITNATGVDVTCVKLLQPTITTTDVNGICFAISATSENPEASMLWLNEMYTNPDIVNLLDWGVEGVHYELQDDGTIDFPEGVDSTTSSYNMNMDWFFGNQFLSYIFGYGRDTTIYSRLEANNKNANFSPAMGFTYDSTVVRNELTELSNVKSEYGPGLETGTTDPATELPKFIEALKAAGIDKVIEEKQTQLDAWLAEQQ